MATTKSFSLDAGSDKTIYFVFKDKNGLLDLTGYEAAMQVVSNNCVIDTLTTANKRIRIDGSEGRVVVKFFNRSTEKYPRGEVKYDIELESPDGDVTRVVEGRIKVSQGVTNVKSFTRHYG